MQIKTVNPINFLFFRTETKVDELGELLPVAKELFAEAVRQDLWITGPIHWHYIGFSGDITKPFTLEIALPVSEVPREYDGKFHFKRTEPFKCVSLIHEGAWLDLPQSYSKMMSFIVEKYLHPTGLNRELYVNADFHTPAFNVTEIQMGIA